LSNDRASFIRIPGYVARDQPCVCALLPCPPGPFQATSTDASGNYEAVDVKARHYTVEASNIGFETTRVDGLELGARQTLRVDVTLTVGQFSQHMEVKAASVSVITTETETVSSILLLRCLRHVPGRGLLLYRKFCPF
jgi:hypothetical protein